GDATLRTAAEFDALFAAIVRVAGPDRAGLVDRYRAAAIGKEQFFAAPMYMVGISDWPATEMRPEEPVPATGDARIALRRADPGDPQRVPAPDGSGVLLSSSTFSLVNSGNRTKHAPKRSWQVDVEPGGAVDRTV